MKMDPPVARIIVSPRLLAPYDTATFSVVFDNRAINTSAARESLLRSWAFPSKCPGAAIEQSTGIQSKKESISGYQLLQARVIGFGARNRIYPVEKPSISSGCP